MLLPQTTLPTQAGDKRRYGSLVGASVSLAVSEVVAKHHGVTLIIAPDNLTALQFQHELDYFLPNIKKMPFPDWETLPYDHFSPHQDIISERLQTLYQLPRLKHGVVIVPLHTLMQYLAPTSYLEQRSFVLKKGDDFDLENFRQRLAQTGYRIVDQVMEHGEFALRGSIIDLFPMGSKKPFRIDLFDNEVDSIRIFDPDNQRSQEDIEQVSLLPAHEYPLDKNGIARFRQSWREIFSGNPTECPIYQRISDGESVPGIEYYLSLFFDNTASLFDYLPENSLIISLGNLQNISKQFFNEVNERYEQLRYDTTKPILEPNKICLQPNSLFERINQFPQIIIEEDALPEKASNTNFSTSVLPDITVNHQLNNPLVKLQDFLKENQSRILFFAETQGRQEVLTELLNKADIYPGFVATWNEFLKKENDSQTYHITVSPIHTGCQIQQANVTLITEAELFGQQVMQRRLAKHKHHDTETVVRNLAELNIGDPVVHLDHGVGRYQGLSKLATGELETEYVTIEYDGGDRLYVPVASLHLLARYSGGNLEHAPLNRLGTQTWEKAKRRAREKIRDVAAELLDIYAQRASKKGYMFKSPDADYEKFSSEFPFEETPDQQQAISKIIEDMATEKVMDRLVCGDVGFGKTEVAMRAAFLAVQSGKQVALLVPTTLLSEQHLHNFLDRFAKWPIKIAALSRFRTQREQKNIIKQIEEGTIDIVIGTHKLIQPNIKFKDLGLLIVDEEHRFGVRQKEKIKAMRANVDLLTLTATPIPRTLNMSLVDIRDLSIIATPPVRRLSIKTFISERNKGLLREAIMREILRGGQVYFLHNEVATIDRQAEELKSLVPEAKINIAHGQMRERQLETIMSDFYHQRFHVLVCSTIIESGIDIPSANTIVINKANHFGLAQLHQLRGRVGRSHHQAYAYLITPPKKSMTRDAKKRLEAFQSLDALGAGFTLATHDLEIRGAGELLGEEQSGHIEAIGFSLFMELLDQTVKALKSGKKPELDQPLHHSAEIDLHVPALIPEDYVFDVHTRLTLYKRIASAKNKAELKELQVEFIDRFGLLPDPVRNLFTLTEYKLEAQKFDIKKIDIGKQSGKIEFHPKPSINVASLLKLIQTHPKIYKLEGSEKLRFSIDDLSLENKLNSLKIIFDNLITV